MSGSCLNSLVPPDNQSYTLAQRTLHWLVVALCISQVPTSWAIARTHMAHGFMKPDPFDLFLHSVHAWSGWAILAFAIVRLGLRVVQGVPELPDGSSTMVRWGSATSHTVLYALLFALPVTGTGAMYISGAFAPAHRFLTWCLLVVAILHAVAALWHHFVKRDHVLRRIILGSRASAGRNERRQQRQRFG